MEHRRLLLCALPLLLLGCSPGQPASAPLSDADAIDYPTYLARFIRANCAMAFDCCDGADRAMLGVTSADYDTCVAESEAASLELREVALGLIESGAIAYDGVAAARCVAHFESATCLERAEDVGRYFDHPCVDVARGTAPLGADCSDGRAVACESGYCRDGICTALPRAGEACDGALCDGSVCSVGGVCAPPELEGGPCMRDMQCERGLYCQGASWETDTPGTCVLVDRCIGS